MPVLLFAGLDTHRQPVLRRRQRAGGVGGERAGWVVGLIEIEHDVAVGRQGGVEKTARAVGFPGAGLIAEYVEKLFGVGGFQVGAKSVLAAVQIEFGIAGTVHRVGLAQDVENRNLLGG